MENQFEEILEIHRALKEKIRDTEERAIQSGIIEVWKQIDDFNYEVSSHGNIKKIGHVPNDAEFLKGKKNIYGRLYIFITGYRVSKRKREIRYPISKPLFGPSCERVYIHRAVAEAFIPNPQNKRIVSHRDGNKSNNNVNNLYWR